nr:LysM domain receptor-like kinase 3 isoform X2 [Tanacetum cinerariifolium]
MKEEDVDLDLVTCWIDALVLVAFHLSFVGISLSCKFIEVEESDHKSGVKHWWIVGGLGGGLAVILVVVAVFVCARLSIYYGDGRRTGLKDHEDGHKFHILRTSSFWCRSGRLFITTDVFDVEKPVVFTYKEVLSCIDFFSESNLLGHGTYGSVYYGLLHEQVCCLICYLFSESTCHNLTGSLLFIYEVAVKRLTAMKTKEFIAEMKVLCKVHHTNLVELIGYAASDDGLFLIYEYA